MRMTSQRKAVSGGLKNNFPFRLGTTSFILPAGYAENVAFLGPLVDDVELLFFECKGANFIPEKSELQKLEQLKNEYGLSYTLHLPLDLCPGFGDELVRRKSMESCRRLVAETSELKPLAWILHVPAPSQGQREKWHFESFERSIEELENAGLERKNLCLETLDYPFTQVLKTAEKHDVSLCIDIGHLLFHGFSVEDCLASCMKRCRVVHLHGFEGSKDHREISHLKPDIIKTVIDSLFRHDRDEKVLTLEVFGHREFVHSMETMKGYLR